MMSALQANSYTSRQKRIKCDEQRPECGACMRSLQPCPGYPTREFVTSFPVSRSSNKRQSSDETVQPASQPPKEDRSKVPPMREGKPESSRGGNAVKSDRNETASKSNKLNSKEAETDLPFFLPCSFPGCGEMAHSWMADENSRRFCGGHRCTVAGCPQQIFAESHSRRCKVHSEKSIISECSHDRQHGPGSCWFCEIYGDVSGDMKGGEHEHGDTGPETMQQDDEDQSKKREMPDEAGQPPAALQTVASSVAPAWNGSTSAESTVLRVKELKKTLRGRAELASSNAPGRNLSARANYIELMEEMTGRSEFQTINEEKCNLFPHNPKSFPQYANSKTAGQIDTVPTWE